MALTRPVAEHRIIEEESTRHTPLPDPPEHLRHEKICYILCGYFPHYQYFENVFPQVRDIFRKPESSESIGIHVRRTDAQSAGFHDHTPNYFLQAWRKILPSSKTKTIIFSDDKEWCRQHLLTIIPDSFLSEHEDAVLDFWALAATKYKIISASTFSWWAAFLADTQTVVVPKPWHVPGSKEPDLGLPHWIRFPVDDLPSPRFCCLEYCIKQTTQNVIDFPNNTESTAAIMALLYNTPRKLVTVVTSADLLKKLKILYPPSNTHDYMFISPNMEEACVVNLPRTGFSVVHIHASKWMTRFWIMTHFRKHAEYTVFADIDYFVNAGICADFSTYFSSFRRYHSKNDETAHVLIGCP